MIWQCIPNIDYMYCFHRKEFLTCSLLTWWLLILHLCKLTANRIINYMSQNINSKSVIIITLAEYLIIFSMVPQLKIIVPELIYPYNSKHCIKLRNCRYYLEYLGNYLGRHIFRNVNWSMFTLDTYVLVKCTHFIVWISYGHRGYSLRPISLCFALLCFTYCCLPQRAPGSRFAGSFQSTGKLTCS